MGLLNDVTSDLDNIISVDWSKRKGTKFPASDQVALQGGAVELDANYLYADLANSSRLARDLDRRVTARILKSFLATTTRAVRSFGGEITSFDGDRILGVFMGDSKNTDSTKCALTINYIVTQLIRPKFEKKYSSVQNLDYNISHGVGVDTGTVLVVRAGARGANDLISIGRAPNLAARLSDLREAPYSSFITASVYNSLHDSAKYGGQNNQNMWEDRSLTFLGDKISLYRSSWWWKPS